MTKPTPLETLTRGHRHSASDSPAAIRVRRKHAESAARFRPDPRMERMLELHDAAETPPIPASMRSHRQCISRLATT